jgi:hypothetical protein
MCLPAALGLGAAVAIFPTWIVRGGALKGWCWRCARRPALVVVVVVICQLGGLYWLRRRISLYSVHTGSLPGWWRWWAAVMACGAAYGLAFAFLLAI